MKLVSGRATPDDLIVAPAAPALDRRVRNRRTEAAARGRGDTFLKNQSSSPAGAKVPR
jgi:hypothetical protein